MELNALFSRQKSPPQVDQAWLWEAESEICDIHGCAVYKLRMA
jgi:hypothetical protein